MNNFCIKFFIHKQCCIRYFLNIPVFLNVTDSKADHLYLFLILWFDCDAVIEECLVLKSSAAPPLFNETFFKCIKIQQSSYVSI